jgi:hypothetical protein
VSLRRRLERLEGATGDTSRSISQEALTRLSDEDLDALEETLEAALVAKPSGAGGSFEDLYSVATERGRRALDSYTHAVEAVRSGASDAGLKDLPGERSHVSLLERMSAGDEDARLDWERRNGYRIWQHYRK